MGSVRMRTLPLRHRPIGPAGPVDALNPVGLIVSPKRSRSARVPIRFQQEAEDSRHALPFVSKKRRLERKPVLCATAERVSLPSAPPSTDPCRFVPHSPSILDSSTLDCPLNVPFDSPAFEPLVSLRKGRRNKMEKLNVPLPKLQKDRWTKEEDETLLRSIEFCSSNALHTSGSDDSVHPCLTHRLKWPDVSKRVPGRTPKQCRERFTAQLDPTMCKCPFSPEEAKFVIDQIAKLTTGSDNAKIPWSKITEELTTEYPLKCGHHHRSATFLRNTFCRIGDSCLGGASAPSSAPSVGVAPPQDVDVMISLADFGSDILDCSFSTEDVEGIHASLEALQEFQASQEFQAPQASQALLQKKKVRYLCERALLAPFRIRRFGNSLCPQMTEKQIKMIDQR